MGGIGSGNRYVFGKKDTVESRNQLDVNRLNRKGLLQPGVSGSVDWSRGDRSLGSIGLRAERGSLILDYQHRRSPSSEWEEVRYPVRLTWTPCNFGGRRPWFICPGVVNGRYCGRRVGTLFNGGKYFLCRHCYDLTYQSRQDGYRYGPLRKCQRIRQRLGGSANMMEPFPPLPKGMHFKTYFRLWDEHDRAEQEHHLLMLADLEKINLQLSRIGRGK